MKQRGKSPTKYRPFFGKFGAPNIDTFRVKISEKLSANFIFYSVEWPNKIHTSFWPFWSIGCTPICKRTQLPNRRDKNCRPPTKRGWSLSIERKAEYLTCSMAKSKVWWNAKHAAQKVQRTKVFRISALSCRWRWTTVQLKCAWKCIFPAKQYTAGTVPSARRNVRPSKSWTYRNCRQF